MSIIRKYHGSLKKAFTGAKTNRATLQAQSFHLARCGSELFVTLPVLFNHELSVIDGSNLMEIASRSSL